MERALGEFPGLRCGGVSGGRYAARDRHALGGSGAPGDAGFDGPSIEGHAGIERRVVIGVKATPGIECLLPPGALGDEVAPFHVGEGGVIRGDEAGAGAALDGHVADGHAAFHREGTDDIAAVLDDVADSAGDTDAVDDGEDDILGGDAGMEFAVDFDRHGAGFRLREGLGGEHVLDLAGADAEGERAERAMGGGVAIAADDGHARAG